MIKVVFAVAAVGGLAALPASAQTGTQTGPVQTTPARAARAPSAPAQNAPINGILTIYGNDKCPSDSICVRAPETERYRIPKRLRESAPSPDQQSWAVRSQGTLDAGVGVNGIGSCSTVGVGGASGCFTKRARAAKAENQDRASSAPDVSQ